MPKICQRSAKIWPRYGQDIPKICPRYAQDMPKIFPRYSPDMPQIYPRFVLDMPRIIHHLQSNINCLPIPREILDYLHIPNPPELQPTDQRTNQPSKNIPNIEPIQISFIICCAVQNWKSGVWHYRIQETLNLLMCAHSSTTNQKNKEKNRRRKETFQKPCFTCHSSLVTCHLPCLLSKLCELGLRLC